ncbi:fungal-specific transcription factor domain-containing protein [Pyronema domesticum]|nr:fungal-specific transcription factor domain-containing protein [Pyronema domesticum]
MSQLSQLPPNANVNVNNINPPSPAESTSTNTKKRPSPSSVSNTPSIPPPTTPHATTFGDATGASRKGPTISRSIQACNRCRARKTRCDQRFPSCSACLKAGVECVGIDAATGREIPRSYVDWLEKRVKHLEEELKLEQANGDERIDPALKVKEEREEKQDKALHLRPDIENLVNQVGVVGVQGTSAEGFMGGSSGISFARLMFSAVKLKAKDGTESATPTSNTPPLPYAPQESSSDIAPDPAASSTIIPRSLKRSSPAPFPDRKTAENLIEIYFQQANPQFPILFRPNFEPIFKRAVDRVALEGTASPNGTCDQNGNPVLDRIQHSADLYFAFMCFAIASAMSQASENLPERYHAAAMMHMDSLFMSVSFSNNRLDGLKGVLLLALYSLMRPAAPGVWYVLGAALRLAVDMGLHQENARTEKTLDPVTIDERRRLFWCTYSLDRQVCVYIGRPFGISDDAIKTPFPVDVDDEFITPSGIRPMPPGRKSSRTVSLHMFRIRQLQSEIQQILYQTSEVPRRFSNLEAWRHDMEQRLQYWIDTAPKTQGDAGCGYNLSFVDLNYQQTRLLLNGLCPAVPQPGPQAYQIIADAGSRIIKAYRHLHREKSINYSWLACHNLFMAGKQPFFSLHPCSLASDH